jgi:hypothetical protein
MKIKISVAVTCFLTGRAKDPLNNMYVLYINIILSETKLSFLNFPIKYFLHASRSTRTNMF